MNPLLFYELLFCTDFNVREKLRNLVGQNSVLSTICVMMTSSLLLRMTFIYNILVVDKMNLFRMIIESNY